MSKKQKGKRWGFKIQLYSSWTDSAFNKRTESKNIMRKCLWIHETHTNIIAQHSVCVQLQHKINVMSLILILIPRSCNKSSGPSSQFVVRRHTPSLLLWLSLKLFIHPSILATSSQLAERRNLSGMFWVSSQLNETPHPGGLLVRCLSHLNGLHFNVEESSVTTHNTAVWSSL